MKRIINTLTASRFESKTNLHLILLILIPIAIYIRVISFDFIDLDDVKLFKNNFNIIGNFNNITEVFQRDALLSKNGSSFYRPLQTVSYMVDALFSRDNPWMYHLSNLIIHILTSISLYYFLRFLKLRNITSFLFALLFSIHPLFASAVSWIPARGDLLITMFGMWIFILFGKHLTTGKNIYFILHTFLFLVIVFIKETSILFPLVLLFYYFYIFKEKSTDQQQPSFLQRVKKLLPYLISWLFIVLFYLSIRNIILKFGLPSYIFGIMPFIHNLPTLPIVIGKFFIPVNLTTLPLYDTYSIIIGMIFLALIIYITIISIKGKEWILLLGIVWFLIFTIPPMLYRIPFAEYYFTYLEHRTYLPIIGLIISAAYFFNKYFTRINTYLLSSASLLIIIIFGYTALLHCDDYRDSLTFFNCAINSNPNNAAAYTNRGLLFYIQDNYTNALADYKSALEIHEDAATYYNRASLESHLNNHISAENDLSKAISLDPAYTNAYIQRAYEKTFRKDYEGAFQDLDKAALIDPTNDLIYYNKGDFLLSIMNYNEAIKNYTKAISLNPTNINIYNNRGLAKYNLNDFSGAIEDYKKVLSVNPSHVQAYINMGLAYGAINQFDNAIDCFTKAISLSDKFPQVYYVRGVAKQRKNDIEGACKDWNEALNLGYSPAKDMLDKFCK